MSEADYIQLVLKHLDSQASPAERDALQIWLEADPQNRLEYQALEKIWSDSGRTLTGRTFDVEAALDKVRLRLTFRLRRDHWLPPKQEIRRQWLPRRPVSFRGKGHWPQPPSS
ncbi:FecR/PupR family sigma factor regulator [Puia sp. P3]|uniref:FecR/PupR family sigma factor regulator n=1 Tax=Puia sp. P3 TaxID=3423952 RepID=UPI003D67ECAF